jgi:phosphoribosylformylglycinamidine synthase
VGRGLVASAHDVSDGGLAVALAECAFAGPEPVGAEVALTERLRPEALLFGESTGRAVVAGPDPEALLALARELGVPARRVGATGGRRLRIAPAGGGPAWIDAEVERLRAIWADAIPRRLSAA